MLKSLTITIIILFSIVTNTASAANLSVSEDNIVHLKIALRYIDLKLYDNAIAEAGKTGDDDIVKFILWLQYQKDYKGNDYKKISSFIKENESWPRLKVLRNRAEQSLKRNTDPNIIIKYFQDEKPVTGYAMLILAEAMIGHGYKDEEVNKLIRKAWVQGDFSLDVERDFLKKHASRLRQEDHLYRIDRLLWEYKISAAKRIIGKVDSEYKTMFTARIYLIQRKRGVDHLINRVHDELRDNPGLLYDRANWHFKRKNYQRAYRFLLQANKTMPYQEKWWKMKNRIIRELLDSKEYRHAYQLSSNHGNEEGTAEFAEAEWLSGWLAHTFLNNKTNAYEHFYAMYKNVNFPVSKARAAYWAGRSAEENGNDDISKKWYKLAAENPTTFYGQMAHLKVTPNKKIKIPLNYKEPYVSHLKHKNNDLAKIAYLLIKVNKKHMAKWFVKAAIKDNNNFHEMSLISSLGIDMDETEFSVIAAKQALKKDVILTKTGWPVLNSSKKLFAEKPMVFAIVRQESLFDKDAKSSAGARGLMQIIPSTAKYVSKKLKVRYNRRLLTSSPDYNLKLGSYYINYLVDRFDGSYLLAIASYNAGPTNVNKWIKKYGDPRKFTKVEEVINWIEHVPFKETRNYIQRVLENSQVYRRILDDSTLTLKSDLMRFNTKISSN